MTPASHTPPAISPDEALPPVEPPSASFLVQLFVIPGLIVLLMVLVWLLINWLPQMGNDAETNVKALEGSGANRWQAAVNLANLLRADTGGELKRNRDLAGRLASKLETELADGGTGEDAVLLRVYLATALGEFYVDTGLDALVDSIETEERTDIRPSLRVAATRAVAVLSNNLERETGKPISDPDAVAAVIAASQIDDSLLRTTAAYALGEMGGDAAHQRLRTLLDDVSHPYARYNAATALARQGESAVIVVLVELLETQQPPETAERDSELEQEAQRTRLVMHGLQATTDLAAANPNVDLAPLMTAVKQLTDDPAREIRQRARAVIEKLRQRSTAA